LGRDETDRREAEYDQGGDRYKEDQETQQEMDRAMK
jgi:hypothetical protein